MSRYEYFESDYFSDSDIEDDFDTTVKDSLRIENQIMNLYNNFLNFKENSNTFILNKLSLNAVHELLYPDYKYLD